MELTENGIDNYLGTYDYYVEKKQAADPVRQKIHG